MGLDMYLSAEKYFGNWKHSSPEEKAAYQAITKSAGIENFSCSGHPALTVNVKVAYWRKANAIHQWFVDNVQNEEDDCREHYVAREQLQTLVDLCKQVLESKNATPLPPQEGCFFGSSKVDKGYWEDLRDTVSKIEALLASPLFADGKQWSFHYRASW